LSVVGLYWEFVHQRKEPAIGIFWVYQVVCELSILTIDRRQLAKEFHHIRRVHYISSLLLFLEESCPFKKRNLQ
jgi:hypothetical protein